MIIFFGEKGGSCGIVLLRKKLDVMENTFTEDDFREAARLLDVEVAVVKTVAEVESGNKCGFVADGKPAILFEGHVFWRKLEEAGLNPAKFVAGNENVLYPKWTKAHYKGGTGEYERLAKAMMIHKPSALESASWGAFQIMGFNYRQCGCENVLDFVKRMQSGCRCQMLLWVEFIKRSGMQAYLQRRDWERFARAYNGKGYKKNQYDERLRKTYMKYRRKDR